MTSLLHFKEKVHQRKLQRADDFSLDKWHHLAAYFAPQGAPDVPPPPQLPQDEQLPQAQQDEILTDIAPPAPVAHTSVHMPEATLPTSPITQGAPPRLSALIANTEYRSDSLFQQMATIRAHQDQIIATQTQHTTILHQIQQH
ncbi:hypothetical protein CK203_113215 [Vitis vinifera]|uniref:Uncharacterized protein n=1 Tax=Vitis vinifera TaxID=29760 RepID=A0A438CA23_VITVI|nr:hypothetical protein CK203_113215 [Vitis vinifera]